MHYYKRNLGDYAKKAGRLSMLQHGAYTLLLDEANLATACRPCNRRKSNRAQGGVS